MRTGRRLSIRVLGLTLISFLLAGAPATAQTRDLEPAVKATFVVRFAAFVRWPPEAFRDALEPVVICIAGDDGFAALVESAARGERVGARGLFVRRIGALSGDAGCHILYAAGTPSQSVRQMLTAAREAPVLTVTDERQGRDRGMIHFVREAGRVRFHVDRDAADAANLDINSRLLGVALSVRSRRAA
ncbi:YfiR family protein [Terricaulis sp.]|uniref:YfiR family protein n=1 Tax=Terricaulis sp. TaxID=2768686 RepID=UPI003783BA3D